MNNKVDIEKYAKARDAILKNTNTTLNKDAKNKRMRTKFYDRKLVRNILRNQLKTNKIKGAFHDKEWLRVFLETL